MDYNKKLEAAKLKECEFSFMTTGSLVEKILTFCTEDAIDNVRCKDAYLLFIEYCAEIGDKEIPHIKKFGRAVHAAFPNIKTIKRRIGNEICACYMKIDL
jgi:hypothetical protein